MRKISEILNSGKTTLSFELFPPKTDQGDAALKNSITELCDLEPDFFSCTYGAGGGSRGKTLDIVEMIETGHHKSAMAHLTCVLHSREEIRTIVANMQTRGVRNILALRGDPPKDQPDWIPGSDNFRYSSEMVSAIRESFGDHFSIGVAGFPEGHLLCPDRDQDADYLKSKADAGADFVITQLFFDNQDYFTYVQRLRQRGVTLPVIPGILPITNYDALLRFTALCGATVPPEIHTLFQPCRDKPAATLETGIAFCVRQCRELLAVGAPGLHFYTLNKVEPVRSIIRQLSKKNFNSH